MTKWQLYKKQKLAGRPQTLHVRSHAIPALLNAFLSDKADQEGRFNELSTAQAAARIAPFDCPDDIFYLTFSPPPSSLKRWARLKPSPPPLTLYL